MNYQSGSKEVGVALLVFGFGCVGSCAPVPAAENAYAPDAQTLQLWHFDEGEGQVTSDAAKQLKASLSGGAAWADGKFGGAIRFNGVDGRVRSQTEGMYTFGAGESYTVEAWVKVLKPGQVINGAPLYEMEVRRAGQISYNVKALETGATARCTGRVSVADGKWHHVATVRDAARGKLALFIDGVLDTEVADPTGGTGKLAVPMNPVIGGTLRGNEMLEGFVDEVRISKAVREFTAAKAGEASQTQRHTLENNLAKFTFSATGGKVFLSELIDKKTGVNFIEANAPLPRVTNLWQIEMRADAGTPKIRGAMLDELQTDVKVSRNRMATGEELQFRWEGLTVDAQSNAATVTMSVVLPGNSAESRWRINADNKSTDFGVWNAKFPLISNLKKLSADGNEEFVAIPGGNGGGAGEGQLYRNPFKTLHSFVRTYPCYQQSMQFNAYYGPKSGLYFATYDGASNLKGFLIKALDGEVPVMNYEVHNYPADSGVAGTDFKQTWDAVVTPFQGNWYDAGKMYRSWALKQRWASKGPLTRRTDITSWIRQGAFWMLGTLDLKKSSEPLLRRRARTLPEEEVRQLSRAVEVESTLKTVKTAHDFFKFPIILWSNEWFEGGGDMSPPRYIPRTGLNTYMSELHKRMPGMYYSGYVAPKRFSIEVREYTPEVVASLAKKEDGSPAIDPPMPREGNDRHAFPCWSTPFWPKFWGEKAYLRAKETGMDGFHVDELASATSFARQCFNRDHDHPIGGGTLYTEGHREMTRSIRENARKANPDFAFHHEALNEIYIDLVDLSELPTSPSNNNIPLWEVVYHDYNFNMGRRIIEWNDRNVFPKGSPKDTGNKNIDEFVSSFGETFVWGNQPGWIRQDIVTYNPTVAAITKRFMDARFRALKFLNVGEMMRPLTMTKPLPTVKLIWRTNDTPEHIKPVVYNSTWKAEDGTIGIVLVNHTQQPQSISYKFDLAEAGLQNKKFSVRQIDGAKPVNLGLVNGSVLQRTDSIPAQSVMILEVAPTR